MRPDEEIIFDDDDGSVIIGRPPPRDLLDFVVRTWEQDGPRGGGGFGPEGPPIKPNRANEIIERHLDASEDLAGVWTNPPAQFSPASRDLAAALVDIFRTFNWIGKLAVVGVVFELATDPTLEVLGTGDYDVSELAQALYRLPVIAAGRARQQVQYALVKGGFDAEEDRYWRRVDDALGRLMLNRPR